MRKSMKNIFYSAVAFLILGLGISLQIKAGIGQSMLNAFAMTIAELTHLSIGTLLNLLNLLFFIIYLFMRKSRFNTRDFIQLFAIIANGYIINYFVYDVFSHLVVETYFLRVALFLIGVTLASISLGAILAIGVIKFPLESLCIIVGERLNKTLTNTRLGFDIVFMVSTALIAFLSKNTLYIREGTIISFFLLSRLMGSSYDIFKSLLKRRCKYV